MCAGYNHSHSDGYDDSGGAVGRGDLIWLECPHTFTTMSARDLVFEELKTWRDGGFLGVAITPSGHVWILAPQPGCENDIAEMSP